MVRVPFDWSQDYKKDTYNQLVTRINKFNKVSVIGADISNTYNMYKIEMGKLDGPTIYVQASLHGNEWEGTTFSMRFMEMLRDNQIGDRQFRNHLLSRYHIVYLPMANPWGFANDNRYNEVGEDLNRDFYDFTQKESRLLRDDYQRHLPFSFLDIHLMQILYNSHELIIGSGHYEHMQITNEWSDDWEAYMGEPVRRWTPQLLRRPVD